MGKTLVVVESPAKAKTIKKYLGAGFEVLASKGHVKDLPKKMGIDVEKGFQETYEVVPGKEKVLAELKAAAKLSTDILLATDPDREGEAIAWHLAEELTGKPEKAKRVEFHEITKNAVQKGVNSPRALNKNLYDAQRARRVLDRIVGYDVSALVWSKLAFGLSAGRVQSVALRLIVDKEREIEAFIPEEYWNLGATLVKAKAPKKIPVATRLTHEDGKKLEVKDGETAARVKRDLESSTFTVVKVTTSERKRKPAGPYSTSKLQQDAVNRLGFGAKRTMQVAQGLYEGVDLGKDAGSVGLITYMRTDSTRVSPEALAGVRDYIVEKFGKDSLPKDPNEFKSKKNAQDAHEAIRPTSLDYPPETVRKHLKDEQFKLYKLIWDRFVASQMKDAIFDQTGVDIEAKAKGAPTKTLRASGRVLKYAGWLAVYGEGGLDKPAAGEAEEADASEGEGNLPEMKEGELMELLTPPGVLAEQKFTQPPARYNEGSLVRELEERGIGRPSTYAEIISKVQARDYVEKPDGRTFRPTLLGKMVVDGLVSSQLDFMDPTFTSSMELELDAVEAGEEERTVLLSRFYKKFRQQLDLSKKGKRWNPDPEPTGEACELCGPNAEDEKLKALPRGEMMKRWSKNGWFAGCSNYPKCKNTRDMGPDGAGAPPPRETGIDCDKCGKPMQIRSGRYGEFLSCTGYPGCKNARPVPLGVPCPKCGGDLIEVRPKKKGGKTFYGCSRYNDETVKCDFKLWQKPIPEPCPACGAKFVVMGGTKAKPMIACADKECGYKRAVDLDAPVVMPVEGDGAPAQLPRVGPGSRFFMAAKKPGPRANGAARPRKPKLPPAPAGEGDSLSSSYEPFPIVALGGSAGSLEALEAFFNNLPPTTGASFVVITHRDAQGAPFLPKVLATFTSMRVATASHGIQLEPDVVYVAPPGLSLGIEGGAFVAGVWRAPRGKANAIDDFFHALAEYGAERAIGIVLSGMNGDGAAGLRTIRERGGLALVQAPDTAPFDSMPKNAIEAGPVDAVAAPDALALHVANLVGNALPPPQAGVDDQSLRAVLARLHDRQGHDFSAYKPATLRRRIERRMQMRRIVRAADYVALLDEEPKETALLFDDLLIGVTRFFRDPEVFEALARRLLPKVIEAKPRTRPLRVWVAGCATGEEAYSMAIIVLESLEKAGRSEEGAQIYATDLDKSAIEQARRGFYPATIAAEISPERLARFFVAEDGGYRVAKKIRELCVFAPQSLTSDPPFTKLDVLSCRNVLIYLTSRLQQRLVGLFFYALNPGGLLVLGGSETVSTSDNLFARADATLKVFKRREGASVGKRALGFPLASRHPEPSARVATASAESSLAATARRLIAEEVAPLCLVIDPSGTLLYASQRSSRYLEQATGRSPNVFDLAREGLEIHLRALVRRAIAKNGKVSKRDVLVASKAGETLVSVSVMPIHEPAAARGLLLVVLGEGEEIAPTKRKAPAKGKAARGELDRLKERLKALVDERETSRREVRSASEELQTTNEELQSTNEELMTSKEEMESMNEELLMLNAELQSRNEQLAVANDDMRNVINSSQIPTLFLDNQLRIKRFTAEGTRVANLIATDVGRPITDITLNVQVTNLPARVRRVLDSLVFEEAEVRGRDGTVFMMRIHPYRTRENLIDGVVVTFLDITDLRRAALGLAGHEREQALVRMIAEWPGVARIEETSSGRTVAVSSATSAVLGYPAEALARAPREFWTSLVHPDDRDDFVAAVASGETARVRVRDAEGKEVAREARSIVLWSGADTAEGLGCSLHVLT